MTEPIPANTLERMWLAFNAQAPSTTHAEITLPVPLSELALADAVAEVMRQHPMLNVRLDERSIGWTWPATDQPPPVFVDDGTQDVGVTRAQLVSNPFDLASEPPVRFNLLPAPTQARVIIVGDHALIDGLAIRRVAVSLLGALANEPPASADDTWRRARELRVSELPAERVRETIERLRALARSVPTHIARERDAPMTGYGVSYRTLSDEASSALNGVPTRGATPNDAIVAAVALALMGRNEAMGHPRLPMTIGVPVNLRPHRSWTDGVCNAVLPWPVRIEVDEPTEVLGTVARQMLAIRAGLLSPDVRALLTYLGARGPSPPLWALHGVASMTTMVSSVPAAAWSWRTEGGTEHLIPDWGGAPASPAMSVTFAAMVGRSSTRLTARYLTSHHSAEGVADLLRAIDATIADLYATSVR